ncbi:glycosyltransferase family 39 protein [Rhodococcus opacus]|nr:glycosyltransferase family 39 protein [Rhodococcus opacus]
MSESRGAGDAGQPTTERGDPSALSAVWWPGLGGVALAVAAVLVATSGGYGYHRDELYFLRAGRELAFGYVDQPPLTPLLARVALEAFGDSLVGLRLFASVAAGLVVLCTGLLAREFGGGRAAQLFSAACMGVSAYLIAVGHLLSTSTFDLLAWTVLSWLVVRALRQGGAQWLLAGVTAGVGLQNKTLVAFLLGAILIGLVTAGPRAPLRTPWPWAAAAVAVLLWLPAVIWQAAHGWPQLEMSAAIASGSSGTSAPRWLFLPYQLVLVNPLLVPVWVVGLWRLARTPMFRAFAVAYAVLAVVFLLTTAKPYYLAGLFPVLLAAGAGPVLDWARRGATRIRTVLLAAVLVVSAVNSAALFLPLIPVDDLHETPVVAVNYDAGETIGWPRFAQTIADAHAALPSSERRDAVVLAGNYGEAGAVDRYGPELGLPPVFSGHNSYWSWGPPPEQSGPVIAVGFGAEELRRWFGSVEPAGRIDNGVRLDNDEQGETVWICRDRLAPWVGLWPHLRRIG